MSTMYPRSLPVDPMDACVFPSCRCATVCEATGHIFAGQRLLDLRCDLDIANANGSTERAAHIRADIERIEEGSP